MSLDIVIQWFIAYKYFIIFPLVIVEGPIVMVVSGFFLRHGYFEIIPLYVVLLIGDFIADLGWYVVGFFGARPLVQRYGRFVSLTPELFEKIEQVFHRHTARILIISKLTMGFGFSIATLVSAGASRVSFRKYVMMNFIGDIFWTGLLMGVGFYFGHLYLYINKGFRFVALGAFIIIVAFALWGFRGYVRKRLMKGTL